MPDYPDLIDIAFAKSWLGLTREENDDLLASLISAVSDSIQRRAGQPLVSGSLTYAFTGSGAVSIALPYWPVSAVSALASRDAADVGAVATAETTTFTVARDRSAYYLQLEGGFLKSRLYTATLTVGAAETPGRIVEIALEMLAHLVKGSSAPQFGDGRMGLASVSVSDSATRITRTVTYLQSRKDWLADIDSFGVVTI